MKVHRSRYGGSLVALLSPSVVLLLIFVFVPMALTIWLSFHRWSTQTPFYAAEWSGIGNFVDTFDNGSVGRDFQQALLNTLVYAISSIAVILPMSLSLALLIHQSHLRGAVILRTILFSAYMVPMIAVSLVWSKLYSPSEGPINVILGWIGIGPQPWLSRPSTALYSLVILNVWQQVGYFTVLTIAGLTQIPISIIEAARIDGAGSVRQLWSIVLPLLRRTLLFNGVIALINAIQVFEPVAMITQGGPLGATNTLTYHIRKVGIERSEGGLASAMALVLMVILALIVSTVFFASQRRTDQ